MGALTIEIWPRTSEQVRIAVALRGFTPRNIELNAENQTIWRGTISEQVECIQLPIQKTNEGRLYLHLQSDAAPGRENEHAGGRELGFAVCGLRIEKALD